MGGCAGRGHVQHLCYRMEVHGDADTDSMSGHYAWETSMTGRFVGWNCRRHVLLPGVGVWSCGGIMRPTLQQGDDAMKSCGWCKDQLGIDTEHPDNEAGDIDAHGRWLCNACFSEYACTRSYGLPPGKYTAEHEVSPECEGCQQRQNWDWIHAEWRRQARERE